MRKMGPKWIRWPVDCPELIPILVSSRSASEEWCGTFAPLSEVSHFALIVGSSLLRYPPHHPALANVAAIDLGTN